MLTKTLETTNNSKHFLKCYLILVCKYRKKLFMMNNISDDMKQIIFDISKQSNFSIEQIEADKDHLHLLIRYIPRLSISSIVNRLKSISTNRIWKKYYKFLRKHFWKENTFWTDGYFVSSIGYASQDTVDEYIKNQG